MPCPADQFGARTAHDPQQGQTCLPVHLDGMLEQAVPRHAEPCGEPEAALRVDSKLADSDYL